MVSEMAIFNYTPENLESLNPCFSGGWSRRGVKIANHLGLTVLILVLVEDGLGEAQKKASQAALDEVLILVLVEDGLGATKNNN